MKNILVIGANGQIGRKVSILINQQGYPHKAMVRDLDRSAELVQAGINCVRGNLERNFADLYTDCDRVIFTAGSGAKTGYDKTFLVDLWGAKQAIDYAVKYGIVHFIMVSSRGADDPDKGSQRIKPYLIAKHFADNYLLSSGLKYTILRPGRLTNEKGDGLISTTRPADPEQQVISRDNTAQSLLYCLQDKTTIGHIFELYQGTTPIKGALHQVKS